MISTDPGFERRYQDAMDRARRFSASFGAESLAEQFAKLPQAARDEILAGLTTAELAALRFDWSYFSRPKQDPDLSTIPHRNLLWLGGRGSGKTIAGANRIRRRVEGGARSIAVVGPTLRDIERYQIRGEGGSDGILTVFPPQRRPEYKPHRALLLFHRAECRGCASAEKCGGAIGYINSAEEPEIRGPNLDTVWVDEPARFRYLNAIWSNIELSTRLRGPLPLEIILTGTPLPLQLLRELIADRETVTILMAQSENRANLDSSYVARMQQKYGGTRLGRQELEGEILSDNPDALFHASILDATRVENAPELVEVAVSVDPAIAQNPENDLTAIVAGGRDAEGHIFILGAQAMRTSPEKWGDAIIKMCKQHRADTVIVERNRGGDLVGSVVRAAKMRRDGVVASEALRIVDVLATRGKYTRAEPVSAMHERKLIHLVGRWPALETELAEWNPSLGGRSPNLLDAMVWLVWYLARLGEEEKRDYRAGFDGIGKAMQELCGSHRSTAAAAIVDALPRPRSRWGSLL